jgi:hypothetical protein
MSRHFFLPIHQVPRCRIILPLFEIALVLVRLDHVAWFNTHALLSALQETVSLSQNTPSGHSRLFVDSISLNSSESGIGRFSRELRLVFRPAVTKGQPAGKRRK